MRKKCIILLFTYLCLLNTACTNSVKTDNKGSTNLPEEVTNISTEYDKNKDKIEIALKEGLKDETLEANHENDIDYDNEILGINVKEESNQVLLCKDTVNDIVYYVNYGVDYYIYRIKEGKSELVVELPAKRLFYMEGKLYFILESYNIYNLTLMKDGNIYCYDPISGNVSRLVDTDADTMFVYRDGIYYNVVTNVGLTDEISGRKKDLYYYSFVTSLVEKIDAKYVTPYKWNDYFVSYEIEELKEDDELYKIYGVDEILTKTVGLKLATLDQSSFIELTDHAQIHDYSIVGNKLYYILEEKTLVIFDIMTKEIKELPLSMESYGDFTILDGMIYLDSLSQLNIETGIQSVIASEEGVTVSELYTDGENLYGLCALSNSGGYGVMKRIELKETPENAIMLEQEDGKSLEINRYVFKALPIGGE